MFDEYRSIRSWLVRMRRMKYLDAKDVGFGCTVGCTYSTVDAVFSLQSSVFDDSISFGRSFCCAWFCA